MICKKLKDNKPNGIRAPISILIAYQSYNYLHGWSRQRQEMKSHLCSLLRISSILLSSNLLFLCVVSCSSSSSSSSSDSSSLIIAEGGLFIGAIWIRLGRIGRLHSCIKRHITHLLTTASSNMDIKKYSYYLQTAIFCRRELLLVPEPFLGIFRSSKSEENPWGMMNDAAINQSIEKLQLMTTTDCSGNNTMINKKRASTFIEA